MADEAKLDLITVVIQQNREDEVIKAAVDAGAPGATYFYGRGTGVRQRLGLLGRLIEAEKLVVLMALPPEKTQAVVKAVAEAAKLHEPGNGFLFVQRIDQSVGFS